MSLNTGPTQAGERAHRLLKNPAFFRFLHQRLRPEAAAAGLMNPAATASPEATHPIPTPGDAAPVEGFYRRLADRVSRGRFSFGEPPPGGRQPNDGAEAAQSLAEELVFQALRWLLAELLERNPSPCSAGPPAPHLSSGELLAELRSDPPPGGWTSYLTLDLGGALDHFEPRPLVIGLERRHLKLQLLSDLLHKGFSKKRLRLSSATPGRRPRSGADEVSALLLELHLRSLDRWLLDPRRRLPPRRQPRRGEVGPQPQLVAPAALRPLRLGTRLLLLLRASPEGAEGLRTALGRHLGQLQLAPAKGAWTLGPLPPDPAKGPELLGLRLGRRAAAPAGLAVHFPAPELLRQLQRRGLLRSQRSGALRADSWKSRLHLPEAELLNQVAHFFWGLTQHFAVADNGYDALPLLNHYGRQVAACTLGHKLNSSRRQQLADRGPELAVRDEQQRLLTRWPERLRQLPPPAPLPAAGSLEQLLDHLEHWSHRRRRLPLLLPRRLGRRQRGPRRGVPGSAGPPDEGFGPPPPESPPAAPRSADFPAPEGAELAKTPPTPPPHRGHAAASCGTPPVAGSAGPPGAGKPTPYFPMLPNLAMKPRPLGTAALRFPQPLFPLAGLTRELNAIAATVGGYAAQPSTTREVSNDRGRGFSCRRLRDPEKPGGSPAAAFHRERLRRRILLPPMYQPPFTSAEVKGFFASSGVFPTTAPTTAPTTDPGGADRSSAPPPPSGSGDPHFPSPPPPPNPSGPGPIRRRGRRRPTLQPAPKPLRALERLLPSLVGLTALALGFWWLGQLLRLALPSPEVLSGPLDPLAAMMLAGSGGGAGSDPPPPPKNNGGGWLINQMTRSIQNPWSREDEALAVAKDLTLEQLTAFRTFWESLPPPDQLYPLPAAPLANEPQLLQVTQNYHRWLELSAAPEERDVLRLEHLVNRFPLADEGEEDAQERLAFEQQLRQQQLLGGERVKELLWPYAARLELHHAQAEGREPEIFGVRAVHGHLLGHCRGWEAVEALHGLDFRLAQQLHLQRLRADPQPAAADAGELKEPTPAAPPPVPAAAESPREPTLAERLHLAAQNAIQVRVRIQRQLEQQQAQRQLREQSNQAVLLNLAMQNAAQVNARLQRQLKQQTEQLRQNREADMAQLAEQLAKAEVGSAYWRQLNFEKHLLGEHLGQLGRAAADAAEGHPWETKSLERLEQALVENLANYRPQLGRELAKQQARLQAGLQRRSQEVFRQRAAEQAEAGRLARRETLGFARGLLEDGRQGLRSLGDALFRAPARGLWNLLEGFDPRDNSTNWSRWMDYLEGYREDSDTTRWERWDKVLWGRRRDGSTYWSRLRQWWQDRDLRRWLAAFWDWLRDFNIAQLFLLLLILFWLVRLLLDLYLLHLSFFGPGGPFGGPGPGSGLPVGGSGAAVHSPPSPVAATSPTGALPRATTASGGTAEALRELRDHALLQRWLERLTPSVPDTPCGGLHPDPLAPEALRPAVPTPTPTPPPPPSVPTPTPGSEVVVDFGPEKGTPGAVGGTSKLPAFGPEALLEPVAPPTPVAPAA